LTSDNLVTNADTDIMTKTHHIITVNKLTSYIVHDINNVLQTILGCAEILMLARNNDDIVKQKAIAIKTASVSAIRLMKYIIDINYKRGLEKRKLNINYCIENMQDIIEKICGNRITVCSNLNEHIPLISSAELYVEEILLNLVINARDAIITEGVITIETGTVNHKTEKEIPLFGTVEKKRYAYIAVKDNGIGMSGEVKKMAYKPTFTTKKNGNGVGLHIVFAIAKELSGYVTIKSAEYKGTTVTVHIPESS